MTVRRRTALSELVLLPLLTSTLSQRPHRDTACSRSTAELFGLFPITFLPNVLFLLLHLELWLLFSVGH